MDFLLVAVTGGLVVDVAVLLLFTVVAGLVEVAVVERGVVVVDALVDAFLTVVVAVVPVAGLVAFGLTVTPAAAKEDALRTLVASGML